MNNPLVSIIIPAYNSEKYITECLQSVLDQSWTNREIIVVNDGSTDTTRSIILNHKNQGIKLVEQENKGAAAARNNGLKYSKGDYIQFLDSDDLLSPNKLLIQVNALNGKSNKLAACSTIYFKEGSDHLLQKPPTNESTFLFDSDDPAEFLINLWGGNSQGASMIQTNAWLIPRTLINRNSLWEEFYSPDDDGEYFSRLLLSSEGLIYTKGCYNYYRKFTTSQSLSNRNSLKALEGCFKSINLKKKSLLSKTKNPRAKLAIAKQLIDLAVSAYPKHRTLSRTILLEVDKLGSFDYSPIIGGTFINTISFWFGWKFARQLSTIRQALNVKKKNHQ